MKKVTWVTRTIDIRLWLISIPEHKHNANMDAIKLSIQLGDTAKNDKLRSTYWTAIRSIGSTLEGFPIERRKRAGRRAEWKSHEDICNAMLKRLGIIGTKGDNGFLLYDESVLKNLNQIAEKLLQFKKNGQWNGRIVDGVPDINQKNLN